MSEVIKLSDVNSSLVNDEVSTSQPSVSSTTTERKELSNSTEPLFGKSILAEGPCFIAFTYIYIGL